MTLHKLKNYGALEKGKANFGWVGSGKFIWKRYPLSKNLINMDFPCSYGLTIFNNHIGIIQNQSMEL